MEIYKSEFRQKNKPGDISNFSIKIRNYGHLHNHTIQKQPVSSIQEIIAK